MKKKYKLTRYNPSIHPLNSPPVTEIIELEEIEEVTKPLSLEEQVRIRQMLALQNVAPKVKEQTLEEKIAKRFGWRAESPWAVGCAEEAHQHYKGCVTKYQVQSCINDIEKWIVGQQISTARQSIINDLKAAIEALKPID